MRPVGQAKHLAFMGRNATNLFLELLAKVESPQSTFTDYELFFTARFVNVRDEFEYKLSDLDIIKKNASPNHAQTRGEIGPLHHTPKLQLT